jgi:hypothetical protein
MKKTRSNKSRDTVPLNKPQNEERGLEGTKHENFGTEFQHHQSLSGWAIYGLEENYFDVLLTKIQLSSIFFEAINLTKL